MDIICQNCGVSFVRPQRAGRLPSCCSRECYVAARREKDRIRSLARYRKAREAALEEMRVCQCCGSEFARKDGHVKYCSVACRKLASSRRESGKRRARRADVAEHTRTIDFWSIWERDGGRCSHCDDGLSVDLRGTYNDLAPEVDHIIPVSKGGHHAPYNAQILCRRCNVKKGNKIYEIDLLKAQRLMAEEMKPTRIASNG